MSRKTSIKPITYMKTYAADILATVSETRVEDVLSRRFLRSFFLGYLARSVISGSRIASIFARSF